MAWSRPILHLIPHLVKGGAERQLVYMAAHWARMGRDVHIAYLSGTPVPTELQKAGVTLHPLVHFGNYDPLLLVGIVGLIRRLEPAIVQTWLLQMDVLGGCAALLTRTPWVLREPVTALHWTGGAKVSLRKWLGTKADAIVSNSSGGDAYWQEAVPQQRRFIIKNVVPLDEIHAACGFPENVRLKSALLPLIVLAGRLDQQKNFEVTIRALANIVDEIGAQVVIFGEGPLRSRLEGVINQYQMKDRFLLPGVVPNIWGALKAARLFVSMSRYEGNPNVVLEAMACGCPAVLSDIPAHREVLDDDSAFFVEQYENYDSIAKALMTAWSDPDAALAKSRSARSRLHENHHVSAVCVQYDGVYQAVIQRRNR